MKFIWIIISNSVPKYLTSLDLINENSKIKELKNRIAELMYQPGGIGYCASKEHFEGMIKNNI